MNKSVIKCNLEVYSAFVLKFGSTTMRPYKFEVQVEKGLNVSVEPDSTNKSIIIAVGLKKVIVSTMQYDHLVIVANVANSNKRQLFVNLAWNMYLLVVFSKGSFGFKADMKQSLRNNYQQDPTMVKKGKYRHRSKSFWTKRSDLPRGKYARDNRFKALADLQVDAKLSRSYNSKFISMKFLAWKLGMSINELQSQLALFRMSNGNKTLSFDMWLNSRLAHVLVLAGFYSSYTGANQAIQNYAVLINGLIVSDINSTVTVGDLITVVNANSNQQSNIAGLLINYCQGSIFVKAIPTTLNSSLIQLNSAFAGEVDSNLLDPMTHWLNYTAPFLGRSFNR